ncbi:TPA: carbohydrate-binding domain-containing protein [Streptococcus suis]
MNKRLYVIASATILAGALSMGAVAVLQGGNGFSIRQSSETSSEKVTISLADGTATATSDAVAIDGATVTISQAGQYEVTGQAEGVQILVTDSVTEDVTISLNNASLSSIAFSSTGLNTVELIDGTVNSLSGAETGVTAPRLTVTGQGSLDIANVTTYGMFASEELLIESGTITITSAGSGLYAKHETDANQANVAINGGTVNIAAGQAEGATGIFAGNNLTVNDGTITVSSAFEAYVGKHVVVNGGTANLTSIDDGIVSKDPFYIEGQESVVDITFNGGSTSIVATGDGVDSNGNLTVAGGTLVFTSPSQDNAAMDYSGTASLTGGTVWAVGASNMAQSFTTASQNYIMTTVYGVAGDTITITDAAGNEIATLTAPVEFSSVLFSTPELVAGEVYFVSTTSGSSGQATAALEVLQ